MIRLQDQIPENLTKIQDRDQIHLIQIKFEQNNINYELKLIFSLYFKFRIF